GSAFRASTAWRSSMARTSALFLFLFLALLLAGCARTRTDVSDTGPLAGAEQLVLVTIADWDSPRGKLRSFERAGDGWRDVGAAAVKGSTEPMRRDIHVNGDHRYRIGFVIEHNAAGVAYGGSCIFAHVWKTPADATAGCTAMSDEDMQALLRWLDRKRTP